LSLEADCFLALVLCGVVSLAACGDDHSDANNNNNNDNGSLCGNQVREAGEACDGTDLGGATCASEGFTAGQLGCSADCELLTETCTRCGNGTAEGISGEVGFESCDGSDLRGADCTTLGYANPCVLSCTPECAYDVNRCDCPGPAECGNGVREAGEACDGTDLDGQDCLSLGFDSGELACSAECDLDTAGCVGCGDGQCTGGETATACPADCGVQHIAASGIHSCAVLADGTVRCWGTNTHNVLGLGPAVPDSALPATVPSLADAATVAVGDDHSCALKTDGTVWCWGDNSLGQLGHGCFCVYSTPVDVIGMTSTVAITAGTGHSCALDSGGQAWCWGDNLHGELGDGTTQIRNAPVAVTGLAGVVAIDIGSAHACAALAGGTVWCWGDNTHGQLGDTTPAQSATPIQVPGLIGIVAVSTGATQSCALDSTGQVSCWGDLGAGVVHTTPQTITLPTTAGLAGGGATGPPAMAHSCWLLQDTSLRCLGDNDLGQLGDGTFVDRPSPAVVGGLTGVTVIATGGRHSCAVLGDGTSRCWGENLLLQLGYDTAGATALAVPGQPTGL
jgi:alpha-tubulin suppressor-like RCC1 family protein